MKSFLKILLGSILCLLLLLGFSLFLLTFVDLDRFRQPIAEKLSSVTGLTVEMESLHLEFTHGLGFRCEGLRFLSKDSSKDPFYAEKIYLLAELKPLLKKQVKIKKATIVNPIIKMDLASFEAQPTPTPLPQKSAADDARERQSSQESNQIPSPPPVLEQGQEPVDNPPMQVKDFEKILRENDLTIQNIEIRNGQILLAQKSVGSAPARIVPISVSFFLNLIRPAPDRMEAKIDSLQLEIDALKFHGSGRLTADSDNPLQAVADLESAPIDVAELKGMGKYLPSLSFPDQLTGGHLEKISMHLDLPISDTKNLNSLQKNAQMDFTVQLSNAVFQIKQGTLTFSRLVGEGNWRDPVLSHKFWGDVFGGKFQQEGKFRFFPPSGGKLSLAVESGISFKGLNFALLNSANKENSLPSQGKAFGAFKFKGPLLVSKNATDVSGLQWSGSAKGENLAWAHPDFPQKVERVTVRIREGSPALTMAEVEVERLTIQNIPIKKAYGMLRLTPETVGLTDGKIWPENGEIKMTGNFNPAQGTYALNIRGDRLKAEDLSRKAAFGSVKFSGNFDGRLRPAKKQGEEPKKFSHFSRGLSGNFNLDFSDGNIQKIEGLKALLVLLNPSTALEAGKHGLEYKFIGGDFKLRNGLLLTKNFQMDGPQLKMFIVGKADLPSRKLKAEIKALPLQMLDGLVKAVPLLGELLTGGKKGGVLETYFKVTGTLDKPKFELLAQKSVVKKPADILQSILKTKPKPR